VRRAAACGLGSLRLETLEPPQRAELRQRALEALLAGCRDGEWVVRYAVSVGLETLALRLDPPPRQRLQWLAALAGLAQPELEETPVVRLRARLAKRIARCLARAPSWLCRILRQQSYWGDRTGRGSPLRSTDPSGTPKRLVTKRAPVGCQTLSHEGNRPWHVGHLGRRADF
jgi:hypothetical protein